MTRVRRVAKIRRETAVAPDVRAFLDDYTYPADPHRALALRRTAEALWRTWGDEILEDFVAEHAGRRPGAWWKFDAPEPRRRLGGIGTPAAEVLAYVPHFHFGIPAHWVQPWIVEYYTGRRVDVHGRLIGREFDGHDFRGVAIDPDDPPRYESEAAYLDRHKLLSAAERAELDAGAFEPETIEALTDEERDS